MLCVIFPVWLAKDDPFLCFLFCCKASLGKIIHPNATLKVNQISTLSNLTSGSNLCLHLQIYKWTSRIKMNVTSHHPCDLQWLGLRIVSLASWQRCFWFYDPTTGLLILNTSVGGSEIPSHHMGCIKTLSKRNGINYQPQLNKISEPSTVWKQNLSQIPFFQFQSACLLY